MRVTECALHKSLHYHNQNKTAEQLSCAQLNQTNFVITKNETKLQHACRTWDTPETWSSMLSGTCNKHEAAVHDSTNIPGTETHCGLLWAVWAQPHWHCKETRKQNTTRPLKNPWKPTPRKETKTDGNQWKPNRGKPNGRKPNRWKPNRRFRFHWKTEPLHPC